MTHGWPGSVFEFLQTVGPLTDPPAYGGRAEDAFDLVLPSLPGFGFSGKPTRTGWDPDHIARAWAELMRRLGYTRYVAQGGDGGAVISEAMARQAPAGLLGIHINLPATIPTDVATVAQRRRAGAGGPLRAGTRGVRRARYVLQAETRPTSAMMVTRPQTIGYALTDSPVRPCGLDVRLQIARWSLGERSLTS